MGFYDWLTSEKIVQKNCFGGLYSEAEVEQRRDQSCTDNTKPFYFFTDQKTDISKIYMATSSNLDMINDTSAWRKRAEHPTKVRILFMFVYPIGNSTPYYFLVPRNSLDPTPSCSVWSRVTGQEKQRLHSDVADKAIITQH